MPVTDLPILIGFLLAGLAGSLHCLGMCGPILVAATNVVPIADVRVDGKPLGKLARRTASQLWYHLGRLLTYTLLGFLAGRIGASLIETSWFDRSQHFIGTAAAALAALFGVGMLIVRFVHFRRSGKPGQSNADESGVCARFFTGTFRGIIATHSIEGKLVLGALMGFLPCGLVYAMLPLAAATGSPLLAALGMFVFGLGTVPALSAVVIVGHLLPVGIGKYGEQFAAFIVIAVAAFMMFRAWPCSPDAPSGSCPMCGSDEAPAS